MRRGARARRRGRGGGRQGERRQLGQRLPRGGLHRLQARDDRREALDLRPQRGVALELGLEGGALLGRELAQQVSGDALVHRSPSSSIISRSRASAWTMRIFTVPSGMPVSAAISLWLRPP